MINKIIFALPKGRILEELKPMLELADIKPEAEFFDDNSRKLRFSTNHKDIEVVRIRSFDVAIFLAYGAADIGILGLDVLNEFDSREIYAPLDLQIGKCRLSLATLRGNISDIEGLSHINIATKYPATCKKYFANKSIQAECIKLNGAIELAPSLGLANYIVDLVSSGSTLLANNLVEVEEIAKISSYFAINRTSYKTKAKRINEILNKFSYK